MIRKYFFALCLACLALEQAPLNATTLKALSLDELLARADLVVRGRTRHQRCEWRDGIIVTLSDVEVVEVLRGGPVRSVQVLQLGGRIGEHWMPVAGVARLSTEAEQVLLLRRDPRLGDTYVIAGMSQGALALLDEDTLLWAPRAPLWRAGRIEAPRARRLSLEMLRRRLGRLP